MVPSGFRRFENLCFINHFSKKLHRLASTVSNRKSQWKIGFLMNHSTKNGPVLVILVPGIIKPSGSVSFLMIWCCCGHWGHWGCWGLLGYWGCRGSKAWNITTEDFRVIKILKFSFILMFWRILFIAIIMKYHIEF